MFIFPLRPKGCDATMYYEDGTSDNEWAGVVGFDDQIEYFIHTETGEEVQTLEELKERKIVKMDLVYHQTIDMMKPEVQPILIPKELAKAITEWMENSKTQYFVLDHQEYSILCFDSDDVLTSPTDTPIVEIGTP